jgi:hypothetical protein
MAKAAPFVINTFYSQLYNMEIKTSSDVGFFIKIKFFIRICIKGNNLRFIWFIQSEISKPGNRFFSLLNVTKKHLNKNPELGEIF